MSKELLKEAKISRVIIGISIGILFDKGILDLKRSIQVDIKCISYLHTKLRVRLFLKTIYLDRYSMDRQCWPVGNQPGGNQPVGFHRWIPKTLDYGDKLIDRKMLKKFWKKVSHFVKVLWFEMLAVWIDSQSCFKKLT